MKSEVSLIALSLMFIEFEQLSAEQVDLPLDVSLKSKARFTSLHPFTWTASVKTHQEAEGITEFVRNQSSAEVK